MEQQYRSLTYNLMPTQETVTNEISAIYKSQQIKISKKDLTSLSEKVYLHLAFLDETNKGYISMNDQKIKNGEPQIVLKPLTSNIPIVKAKTTLKLEKILSKSA